MMITFQGGIDDVIYPGETKLIGVISQRGAERGIETSPQGDRFIKTEWVFGPAEFESEISGDGVAMATQTFSVEAGKSLPGRVG
jgi:hypothetical protein